MVVYTFFFPVSCGTRDLRFCVTKAEKLSPGVRPLLGVTSLLVACILPASVIFYLDNACMAQWTRTSCSAKTILLGSVFGRTDFSRIFIFGPPDFFVDFVAGFFSSFSREKVPRKILQENPQRNPLKFTQQKSPTYFLQRGRDKFLGVVLPTFRRSRNSCVFVLRDLFESDKNLTKADY